MLHAIFPYILMAGVLIASLALFLSMKSEIRSVAAASRKRAEAITRRLEEADARLPEPAIVPGPAQPGMNLAKRTQALRMLRRHEDVSRIAMVLGVPRKEIELLARVADITQGTAAKAASAE